VLLSGPPLVRRKNWSKASSDPVMLRISIADRGPAWKMPTAQALWMPVIGNHNAPLIGEVAPVVGVVPVSVDDLADGGAGGGFVDEVLASGERGDQGLQGEVVDRAGVAVCRRHSRSLIEFHR
jgi:hypothetical protein